MKLQNYMQDGANYQARAVLCCLQQNDGIESSWSEILGCYMAEIKVGRWENGREQGYVVSLFSSGRQLNIAWFEHRNSDSIHAVKWEQFTTNSPTIESANFGDVYKDKYSTSHNVKCWQFQEMADWVWGQLVEFWEEKK